MQINGRNFDLRAEGVNLIINYVDQPGTLGKIGTLLGAAGVNIHAAQLSEDAEGPGATILLRLDRDVPADVRAAIADGRRRQHAGSGGSVMKLAIIAGDGIGPEVVGEAVKVLDAVLPGVEKTELRPGRAAVPRDRRGAARFGGRRTARRTTRSCSAPSATRRCPAACWSAVCCCACGSSSTITSICARRGCIPG